MKIAVLSDIHGNVPALLAVLEDIEKWRPDRVIVNGDVVNRGPYSKKVLELLEKEIPNGDFLKGNHESFVLHSANNILPTDHAEYEFRCFAQWSAEQIGAAWLAKIDGWGENVDMVDLDGGASFHVTHASRVSNRHGISAKTKDDALPQRLGEPRDLFIASHTHKAMIRRFNGKIIVNTGSVGQPLDDDCRASYGQFTLVNGEWKTKISRVSYDKSQAEKDFIESGFLDAGGPLAKLMFLEHRHNRIFVGAFMREYSERVKCGEMRLRDAVEKYLAGVVR